MRTREYLRWVAFVAPVLILIALGYVRWEFPYGWSHCCIKGLAFELGEYARAHDGRYPAGQPSPEASLSLLYKSGQLDPYTLSGKTVPPARAERLLRSGSLLGPDSCGWHYVEGLTIADDPRLALLWDKVGLGHNGQRTKRGGREVVFADGQVNFIEGDRWSTFLEEQKRLLEHRSARATAGTPLCVAVIELPGGRHIDSVPGPYTMQENSVGPDGSSSGTSRGENLSRHRLVWYQPPVAAGAVTRALSFSNLVSDPLVVRFKDGIPDATNLVFRMHPSSASEGR